MQPAPAGNGNRNRDLSPWLAAVSVVLVFSIIVWVATAFLQRGQTEALRAEIAALSDEVESLEKELAASAAEPTNPETPPTEPGSSSADDLLDGLLDGDLEGLLNGDLEGLLEGLLGGGFGELFGDTMDDALGGGGILDGIDPTSLSACLEPGDLGGIITGGDPLTGTPEEQVREIARRVEELRGLEFDTAVTPTFLDPDAFAERVAATIRAEYPAEEADLDSRYLSALGAIPFGTDLLDVQAEILATQVAGFYDPDTGELVVPDDGDGRFDTTEQMILAHELDHALTDQSIGLPSIDATDDWDGNLARLALVEGDASLLMQQYALANTSLLDQLAQLADPRLAQQAGLESSHYLASELMFPYVQGLGYVCERYGDGGWTAVDADYRTPPATTAEILFPERADLEPQDAIDVSDPGGTWEVARTDTIGAAQLLWLFEAPGGDVDAGLSDARDVAAAWAGGEAVVATRGSETAVGVSLVDGSGAGTLCSAVDRWYHASFDDDVRAEAAGTTTFEGGRQAATLRCDGDQVMLGIGPDLATAESVIGG